jgi:hypothetical protein
MGEIVKLSDLPQAVRTGSYDNEIKQALEMGQDEALKVEVPSKAEPTSVQVAIGQRIRKLGHDGEIKATKIEGQVYIVHGAMRPKTTRTGKKGKKSS